MTAIFPYLHEVDKERERSRNIQPIDQLWTVDEETDALYAAFSLSIPTSVLF